MPNLKSAKKAMAKTKKEKSLLQTEPKKSATVKKMGRPSKYTEELAQEICNTLATTDIGIAKLCEMNPHWPEITSLKLWRITNEDFSTKYALAKKQQLAFFAEELEDLAASTEKYYDEKGNKRADPGLVAETRLKVDTRKFIVAKLMPKVYGDQRLQEQIDNTDDTVNKLLDIVKDLHGKFKSDV